MIPGSMVLQSFLKSFSNSNFICLLSSSLSPPPLSFAEEQLVFSLGCYDLINFHHRKFPGRKICQHQVFLSVQKAVRGQQPPGAEPVQGSKALQAARWF